MNSTQIILSQSLNVSKYKPIFEGLVDDFGYGYYHTILCWCEIIGVKGWDKRYWQVWLIEKNNEVIGICGLYSLFESIDELWLGWFGIVQQHRNSGVGSKVLIELERIAKEIGATSLNTYVDKEGKPLQFYYRHGFERMCSVKEYLLKNPALSLKEFENEEDHVLRKNIKV